MSSAVPHQSNHSSSAGASSSSTTASNISRPNPSPPMPPGRQLATPPPPLQQLSTPASSLVVRGRSRELQQLNNEIQLLQEELKSLDNIPPASKACKDYKLVVSASDAKKIATPTMTNIQRWLPGLRAEGDNSMLPTIAIVASYDTTPLEQLPHLQ